MVAANVRELFSLDEGVMPESLDRHGFGGSLRDSTRTHIDPAEH